MKYCSIIVFALIGTAVCHGKEMCTEPAKAGMKKEVSFTNKLEFVQEKMAEINCSDALVDLAEVVVENEGLLNRLYYLRGECHYKVNAFGKAETDYRKALLLRDSMNGVAEYMAGKCLFEQEKYHEAHAFFEQALKKFPKSVVGNDAILKHARFQYKCDLALALFEMGRQEEAIQMFHAIHLEFPDEDMGAIMEFIKNHRKTNTPPVSAMPSL